MREKEELYKALVNKAYEALAANKTDNWQQLDRNELITSVESSNKEIGNALKALFSAIDNLGFVRADNHMKLKAMDLWKEQVDMFFAIAKGKAELLNQLAQAANIDIVEELKELKLIDE